MYFIGIISGTSMDAIDTALVRFGDRGGELKFYREYPLAEPLRHQIRSINEKSPLDHVAKLDNELGHQFAKAVNELLAEANISAKDVVAIGSHGQTVLHRPDSAQPTSIQISDPNIISNRTGITTIADFRRMDMASNGQGAPLTSAFHQYQFHQKEQSTIILNIGGMANITLLTDNNVIGFDTGPGNALLDDWIQHNLQQKYDNNGLWARQGKSNHDLLKLLQSDHYFALPLPKSTGRDYFNMRWLDFYRRKIDTAIVPEDIQATLLQLSVNTISDAIKRAANSIDEVLVCGGGVHNALLMEGLRNCLCQDAVLATTEKYGLAPDCIEAVAFAWLAKQRIENKTANLPSVTGANKEVLLGGIYSSQ